MVLSVQALSTALSAALENMLLAKVSPNSIEIWAYNPACLQAG